MAIKINSGRQETTVAIQDIEFGTGKDIDLQGVYDAVEVPNDAIVTGGYLIVDTATTALTTVSIGDTGSPTRYLPATSVSATGVTPLVVTGFTHPVTEKLKVTVAGANPVAVGKATIVLEYVRRGKAEYSQG